MEDVDNGEADNVPESVYNEIDSTAAAAVVEEDVVRTDSINNDIKDNSTVGFLSREDNAVRYQDGSDSGVDVNGGAGIGCIETEGTPVVSCDSSLISCCYSSEDLVSTTLQLSEDFRDLSINTGDGTSEGGSESSSTTGYHKPRAATNVLRKKCSSSNGKVQTSSNRPSLASSSSRSRTPMSRDRSLSGKTGNNKTAQNSTKSLHPSSAKSSTINPCASSSSRSRALSTENTSRGRSSISSKQQNVKNRSINSGTDDGRWPSSFSKANQVNLPKNRPSQVMNTDKKLPHVMTSSFSHVETSSNALEKYATLPRRHRRSAENLSTREREGRNLSREPSLNRTASLRQKHNAAVNNSNGSNNTMNFVSIHNIKSMPPYPVKNRTTKTRIYHEISVQTSLTGNDVDKALAGTPPIDIHSRVEVAHCGIQVDRRIEEVERLESRLKEMQQELSILQANQRELQEVKENLLNEKALNTSITNRLSILITKKDALAKGDVVSALEEQVHTSNDLISKQQAEIATLHALCSTLNEDLAKSYAVQKMLVQQQQEGEVEALEMQDFLQAEKSTLAEALQDTETELNEQTQLVKQKDTDLARLQEECSHLVRISEQRRQEVLSMAARLKSVETRSKDALLQQGAAVSSAAVALSGLGTRLETLVDALVTTYAISEHDLEDVIFHNEAYSDSGSSVETSPQHSSKITPATASAAASAGSGGFINAVLNAIRSATSSQSRATNTENSSESEQMLSLEPEPQAFRNRDVTCDSSPEKRLSIASVDDFEPSALVNSESLQNLTEAILKRQQDEKNESENSIEFPSVLPASTLVDQVIEVDNLITRLLKVLRIIQVANEQSVRIKTLQLSERLNQKEDERQSAEEVIERLKEELHQLQSQLQCGEITDNQIIDVKDRIIDKEVQLNEISRKLCLTKQLLTDNWHQAMNEVRRQYEAIDTALEMMQSVQGIVQQNPILSKVQQNLEETNFQCASMLPVISTTSDLNANAAPAPSNLLNITSPPSPTINGTA
ncbi:microtubule-binding protein cornetto [Lycorma delicatula]|uniref:microtubule-binding protein cornetto n=1 Tax=Lycorma delicatula TaxID=130591 RepID=UPI003F5166DF